MSSPRYVVVKVGTGKSNPREAGAVDSLNDVSFPPDDHPGRAMIPSLRDRFVLNGPNGTYPCYMTAPAQSSVAAVKEASDQYLFQNGTARSIIAQLVQAAEYMHARGFVHGDIHAGNALLCLPSDLDHLSIEQLYEKYGEYQMRQRRTPLQSGSENLHWNTLLQKPNFYSLTLERHSHPL